MFRTPPRNMVNTRSTARMNIEQYGETSTEIALQKQSDLGACSDNVKTESQIMNKLNVDNSGKVKSISNNSLLTKSENVIQNKKSVSKSGRKSSTSSVLARKKKLELEAAEAKARIQMELIDKKLAADLAELDNEGNEGYSSQSEGLNDNSVEVEKWLERSQHEQEAKAIPQYGKNTGDLCLPPLPNTQPPAARVMSNDSATVQMLASALKDLAASNTASGSNANMLSRLCTPRDLPSFSGDPMEWLQFKQAYEDSTKLCNFNDQENLWRLRKCLHGQAKDAVMALLISATSPDTVMSTLELQFGNPDIIISRIMYSIRKLPSMCQEYQKDIVSFSVKIKNYVAAVLATGQDEYLKGMNIITIILSKLPTVLISKWADYSYSHVSTSDSKPKLVILSEFLNEEAIKITKSSAGIPYSYNVNHSDYKRKQADYAINRSQTLLVQDCSDNASDDEKCKFCRVHKHKLYDCKKFKKCLRKERWQYVKRNGLCYKCLVKRHSRESCPAPVCDKDSCGLSHHRLLHYNFTTNNNSAAQSDCTKLTHELSPSVPHIETVTNIKQYNGKVLLKTVPLTIHGPNGVVNTVALLDDGSTVSIISDSIAVKIGLRGCKQTLRVRGAWDSSELVCDSEILNLNVSNRDGAMFTMQARITKGLNLPAQNISLTQLKCSKFLDNIKHLLCNGHCKPELLIGQDNYHLLLPLQIKQQSPAEPYFTLTPLGWCIHGRQPMSMNESTFHTSLFIHGRTDEEEENQRILHELQEEVRRSYTIESMGISSKPRQNSEHLRAIEHLERTSVLKEGRWYVGLPWKDVNCKLPTSYTTALKRLQGVERKMAIDEGYAERYKERISHLLHNDYANEVLEPVNTSKCWYLPHFGVDNPNKKKLRLVFDAAAKNNGFSLNDYLLSGPDLLKSLYGIMLRFREHKVAVTGDIRDMFLRIKIIHEDRDALRFLWRDSPEGCIKTYNMTSLMFGSNCSPFIAQYIKNKNSYSYETTKPAAVRAICHQHYVDDYIDSIEDENTAIQLIQDIIYIHNKGGFEIRNWTSNNETVVNSLPKESLGDTAVRLEIGQNNNGERTLGLIWYPKEDELGFDLSFKRIPINITNGQKKPTKRETLQLIMSIFDVYGFLSPVTIKGKILLQQIWKSQINWDDQIPDINFKKWLGFLTLLKNINCIRLPRCYMSNTKTKEKYAVTSSVEIRNLSSEPGQWHESLCARAAAITATSYRNLQLHIFCDASKQAMCAVAYWRWENNSNNIEIAFISSKCKVAPLKHYSIPRLELQAAVIAARLADTIIREHRIIPQEKYFWCDSSTVLHWIRNKARDYKAFVAHRLGEIDDLTHVKEWRYIRTKLNVADVATRDTCDLSLLQGEWLNGPEFLRNEKRLWPLDTQDVGNAEAEIITVIATNACVPIVPNPERFSSWLRLLKTTSTVLLFIYKCKKLKKDINVEIMTTAEYLLIKYSQSQSFGEDLEYLKNNKTFERKSKLLTLSPFLDEHGVLRVGGRIGSALGVPYETKYPVILDGRHRVAMLIVKYYHEKAAHGNHETVVNNIKQKYWIIRTRPTLKTVASKCMFCRIKKAIPQHPRMGNLPEARMAHHQRPFTFCGVDLFGPMDVTVCRRREKRYGVLFTCMTVRAIHIEIVTNLTTDALIMALRRMAARRGWPQHLFSDNGTNLRGADNELRRSIQEIDQEVLKREGVNYGTTWTFSPPASPHWGGAWERLIRSVKESLKVVLKENAPRDETLNTLMAEIEQIVNSRPLTHVSVTPHSDESLTPNHFLLGSSCGLPILGEFNPSDTYLRKQWRISQRLADLFWKRWVREVLPDMRPRTKWQKEQKPLQVGDLVLIVDPDSPRNVWPRGRIERVMPGKDGRVRVVEVKTKSGLLRRSAARVALIPMGDEC